MTTSVARDSGLGLHRTLLYAVCLCRYLPRPDIVIPHVMYSNLRGLKDFLKLELMFRLFWDGQYAELFLQMNCLEAEKLSHLRGLSHASAVRGLCYGVATETCRLDTQTSRIRASPDSPGPGT